MSTYNKYKILVWFFKYLAKITKGITCVKKAHVGWAVQPQYSAERVLFPTYWVGHITTLNNHWLSLGLWAYGTLRGYVSLLNCIFKWYFPKSVLEKLFFNQIKKRCHFFQIGLGRSVFLNVECFCSSLSLRGHMAVLRLFWLSKLRRRVLLALADKGILLNILQCTG